MDAPSFYREPQVQFLSILLEEVGKGFIQVPRFQRPLIWKVDRQLELLRSIRVGIPIGTIMLWRTNNTELEYHHRLGPYELPAPASASPRQYVLDGVQRLSTLYGALCFPPPPSTVDPYDEPVYDFYFDFDENDFIAIPRAAETAQMSMFSEMENVGRLPLRYLLHSIKLLEYQRRLPEPQRDVKIAVSDHLAQAFRNYKVAIIPIVTDDLDLVTRTFQLINSQGIGMSEVDMVHGLTYSPRFHLKTHLDDLRSEWLASVGWQKLDRDWILRTCKAAFGQHMYEVPVAEFSTELKARPKTLEEVVANIRRAIDFLRERCGVWSPELLPYHGQVVMIAEAFRLCDEPGPHLLDLLEAWFWLSTYGSLFSGMSGQRVQFTLEAMRTMVQEGTLLWTDHRPFSYSPLPRRFRWASVRSLALAIRLDRRQAKLGRLVLNKYGRDGVGKLISQETLGDAGLAASTANCVVIEPEQLDSMRQQLSAPAVHIDRVLLEAHCISPKALDALRAGNRKEFLEIRHDDLAEWEADHVTALTDRFPPQAWKRTQP